MKKELKKTKKKKLIKSKRKMKKKQSMIKKLKVFNTKNLNYNLVLIKMVTFIGISSIFGLSSHKEVPVNQPADRVSYTREIENLNVYFEPFFSLDNYNVVTKANEIYMTYDNESEIEDYDDIIIIGEDELYVDDEIIDEFEALNEPSDCGMKLTCEFESDIVNIANEYGIDPEIMFVIGDQESDGNWKNNGVISSTNDYGVFQINAYNHSHIEEVFGYSSDDLLYDPIKNTYAAAYIISNIISRSDVNSIEEIFGMYNGWTNWQNIDGSVKYVNECMERLNKYFPNYSYENNKELIKKCN